MRTFIRSMGWFTDRRLSQGLPWAFGVDLFGIGCVLAEMALVQNLFDPAYQGDMEYLAMMDRLVGPFPRDYAVDIEGKYPGTFNLHSRVSVRYPLVGTSATSDAVLRVESVQPLSVRGGSIEYRFVAEYTNADDHP